LAQQCVIYFWNVFGDHEVALTRSDFDSITEQDLLDLINAAVPESRAIEYKRDLYGGRDEDKREFLKDVSSFANSSGGHLVIGIEESSGLPVKLSPLTSANPDSELDRLNSLVRDGIDPRINGVRSKAVLLMGGGYAFVIRVPPSWNPPHRVSSKGHNRFYARHSTGAYELSVEELRVLFNSSSNAVDRIRDFRRERNSLIERNEGIVPLAPHEGRLILHVMPLESSVGIGLSIDLQKIRQLYSLLAPIGSRGFNPTYNFDGFANLFHNSGSGYESYTQIFRSGAIEAVYSGIISSKKQDRYLNAANFSNLVMQKIDCYIDVLKYLNAGAPVIVMITLQDLKGVSLSVSSSNFKLSPAFDRRNLELPEITIDDFGTPLDYQRAMRPAFDALWNAAGFARSSYFDKNGDWVKPYD
jgi:hypothetical protein